MICFVYIRDATDTTKTEIYLLQIVPGQEDRSCYQGMICHKTPVIVLAWRLPPVAVLLTILATNVKLKMNC